MIACLFWSIKTDVEYEGDVDVQGAVLVRVAVDEEACRRGLERPPGSPRRACAGRGGRGSDHHGAQVP